jgi:hypothetical protein
MNIKVFTDMNKILEFAYLEYNWNSYHAKPIPYSILKQTVDLYSAIYEKFHLLPFDIAPFSCGVQLEYRENSNALEIEIRGINNFAYLFIQSEKENELVDDRTFSEEDNVDKIRIFEVLEKVLAPSNKNVRSAEYVSVKHQDT